MSTQEEKKENQSMSEADIDCQLLEKLGITRDKLVKEGQLDKLLRGQKSDLVTLTVPIEGHSPIYTEARLAIYHTEGKPELAVYPVKRYPQLDYPYMGYKFSEKEKAELRHSGNLGKVVTLTTKQGNPLEAYISLDPQTNDIIALRTDRINIPDTIKGVTLSEVQKKDLRDGKSLKLKGMTSANGKPFEATLQVNAEKRAIEFIFDTKKDYRQRWDELMKRTQKFDDIPVKYQGLELSYLQQKALHDGRTLELKNLTDINGQRFDAFFRLSREQKRLVTYSSLEEANSHSTKPVLPKENKKDQKNTLTKKTKTTIKL